MLKRIFRIISGTYNRAFFLFGSTLLALAVAIYFLLGKQASDTLTGQMLDREQLSARSGSKSIETFVDLFGKSMTDLASIIEIEKNNKDMEPVLDSYIKKWANTPIGGVVLVDEKGIVLANGNRDLAPEIGLSLADRDYFSWAKTAKRGEVFVSDPLVSRLGSSKNKYIIVVATPVLGEKDNFKGLVAASVVLSELSDEYIRPLKISDKTRIYLVDESGVIIASPIEKFIGVNYLDYILKSNIPGSKLIYDIFKKSLESNDEGRIDIALPDETRNGLLTRFLIARAPVNIGNDHWVLAIATPASEALVFLTPYYFKDLIVVGVALFAFLIISIRIAKIQGYEEGIEEEKKIHGELPKEE